MPAPTWFITGCSTGLGRSLAEHVLAAGHNVVVTARDIASLTDIVEAHPETAFAVGLNVTDPVQISEAVAAAVNRFGTIDVLVNNAGYGYRAAVEEAAREDVDRLFDTNFHGPVNLIKAVLPGMRRHRSGTILNISSIAVPARPVGSGYYAASKAALEAVSGSLRKEVAPLGIRVITVEPGAFRTDFAGRSLAQSATAIEDYAGTAGTRRKEHDHSHGTQPGDPVRAARVLLDAVTADHPPAFLLLGTDALDLVTGALTAELAEIEAWKHLTLATDHDHRPTSTRLEPA